MVGKDAQRHTHAVETDGRLRRGHAEPVIGPAKGRTRWLCPPYGCAHTL